MGVLLCWESHFSWLLEGLNDGRRGFFNKGQSQTQRWLHWFGLLMVSGWHFWWQPLQISGFLFYFLFLLDKIHLPSFITFFLLGIWIKFFLQEIFSFFFFLSIHASFFFSLIEKDIRWSRSIFKKKLWWHYYF